MTTLFSTHTPFMDVEVRKAPKAVVVKITPAVGEGEIVPAFDLTGMQQSGDLLLALRKEFGEGQCNSTPELIGKNITIRCKGS